MQRLIIHGGRPLSGRVRVSGAKNAVLKLMAASLLADKPCVIRNVPRIRDVETMMGVLEHLGVRLNLSDDGVLSIEPPQVLGWDTPEPLVRAMRASVQVMGPLLAKVGRARVAQPGGCAIGARPIDYHLKGFRAMGAHIVEEHGTVTATAERLLGTELHLDYPSVGATENLMMAASLAEGRTVIHNAAREPEVCEVERFLNAMGARICGAGSSTILIEGVRSLSGADYAVMPDRIEAGTLMVAAAITGGDAFIEGAVPEHLEAVVGKFRDAEVQVTPYPGGIRVVGRRPPEPFYLIAQPHPGFPTDMQPQFVALATLARGTSLITEMVYSSRFKHVDELRRLGAQIQVEGRTAIVRGMRRLSGAPVEASDLRAGAALVVAALAAEGETTIADAEHIQRGYERIAEKLRALGARVEEEG